MDPNFNISIDKLMRTLSEILSDKYDCEITLTARKKEAAHHLLMIAGGEVKSVGVKVNA